ncbi:hypothetical protein ID866_8564 [Astraeus odoratus]|nr:hypothetical protein ID866_8564 [Astraeus odoratus]
MITRGAIIVVPSFLEEWILSAEGVKQLADFFYVGYGGGPIAKKTGDTLISAGVKLCCLYGSTECGPFTSPIRSQVDQENWEWIRTGPNTKIRWAPLGDGSFECQVLSCETHQVSVENLPDVKGYATSDVFVAHPTVPGLYKIVGRLDDVLVLSSGEKSVPGPMESVIATSPYVSGVCIFGRGRAQVGVLVEPRPGFAVDVSDDKQVAAFRNQIWHAVEEANKDAPSFSRIFKELILVTAPEKPMLRTGKGSVMKKATLLLYEQEIDALYQSVEASTAAGIEVPLPSEWTTSQVEDWLMVHATAVNGDRAVKPDVDLFEQGFDRYV